MQRSFTRVAGMSLFVLSLVVFSFSGFAQDRIVAAIASSKVTALPGTEQPLARAEYDQGAVDGGLQLTGMSLEFAPSAAQQTALAALMKAQQDPASPNYHKWLTTEQYAERFGMTQADISKASAWLESQGFKIDHVDENRNAIRFSGTVALAQAAFHTQIHKYLVNGESHFANATAISVPGALASSVIRVGGLNDFKLKPMLIRQAGPMRSRTNASPTGSAATTARPQFTSGASGSHFLLPGDLGVIYDTTPLTAAGFTGTGQYIGVIGQAQIVMADITAFRANAGLPANNPTVFVVPNTVPGNNYYTGDINEADLDLEYAGGLAPNANIIFVNSGDVFTSLQYAIANTINGIQLPILTMSYAGCEAANQGAIPSFENTLQEAGVQGQTIINSSGDSGAAACDAGGSQTITSATQGLAVNYPTSSVYVTGVGGSEFTGDGSTDNPSTGSDQYWSDNGSNDVLTSALSYIPEMAWNDTSTQANFQNGAGLSAGGGGVSIVFGKPTWQTGVTPNDGARDVPDISLSASPYHDGYMVCTQVILDSTNQVNTNADFTSSCANGFRISDPGFNDDQTLTVFGGTSASAPSFAGMLSLIEQKLGTPLGNINPSLYTLASTTPTAFHDITTGNNQVPCTTGSPSCPSGSNPVIGYVAGTGYDLATGLGSIDAANLATALGTLVTQIGTTTTLSVSPATPLVGSQVTLTATISPNSGTGTPTGTVTFTIDGTAGTPVSLAGGIAAVTTSFSTGGTHTVTAAYSGDSNYFASTTSSSITISAVGAATTTTATSSAASVALFGSVTLTANVSSAAAGTVAGTVTFTTPAGTIGTAPIVAGASGTGTATLVVNSVTTTNGFIVGSNTITATYGGDSSYGSSSGTTTLTVTNPAVTMTVANMTISSSSPGNSGTSAIALTSTGGYAGTVNLTATASTLDASYSITPTSVSLTSGGTGSATITIQTIAATLKGGASGNLKRASSTSNRIAVGSAAMLGFIVLLGFPGIRKKRWPMLTAVLMLGALSAGLGCGGGGSSGAAPKGTYTVTVIATDSVNPAITVSTNFTVTIN